MYVCVCVCVCVCKGTSTKTNATKIYVNKKSRGFQRIHF